MNRKTSIILITSVIFVIAGIWLLVETSLIVERKASRDRYSDFIQNSLNEDILFIGASHIQKSIKPIELWNKYGYTSYVLTSTGNGVKRDSAMLEIALDYTKPKLVVLDVDNYWKNDELEHQLDLYHLFSDAFPLSQTKIRATLELYHENSARMELLFPWLIYHNRWDELGESDFQLSDESRYLKGSDYETDIEKAELPREPVVADSEIELQTEGLMEIDRFVQKCKENSIEVLLVTMPYSANNETRLYGMAINGIAQKHNIHYIDFNDNHSFLDETIDYMDATHMNLSGASKMTDYLGKYIFENYNISDRRQEMEYANQWNQNYEAYCSWKKENVKNETDLKTFLLMCGDTDLEYMVYMNPESECYKDETIVRLLNNIVPLGKLDEAVSNKSDYFAVLDRETGESQEYVSSDCVETECSLGKLQFYVEEGNAPMLSIDNVDDATLTFEEVGQDICIWAFDKVTGELVCKKSFKKSEEYTISES